MVLPTLMFVLPIAMAFSKSPDIPMLSSMVSSSTPSASAAFLLHSLRQSKFSGFEV